MLQFFAGILYEFARLFASLIGLGAIANSFIGLVRDDQSMFLWGLLLSLIAITLAFIARGLRRFEL